MKTGRRHIQNGKEYNHLFPKPEGENKIIKRVANLDDTLELMKQITATTLEDTAEIAELLKAPNQKQTCSNIWHFCFNHLQYTKDEMGKEQVRRPSRTWQDRKEGVDCDCMSVFIGSILTNLGIPFSFRLTKYQSPEFEHVYPIAHTDNGVIIMDAVVHQFNREVQYSAKKDIKMELQFLNGFEDEEFDQYEELDDIIENDYPMDAQVLVLEEDELSGLFKSKAERKAKKAARKTKRAEKKEVRKEKRAEFKKLPLKEKLKKGLNVINKFNPATALLRAGILASMKLNLMKVPSKLRFAYWTDAEAARNNMDMGKFQQLKQVREKMEKIFFGAGGKTENLKKAILTGRGNRDRKVILNGLGEIINAVYDEDDLQTILGDDLYYDEMEDVDFGINGLGSAAATGAAVTAAAGIIGTIAGLIKKIGGLFKKGTPQAEQEAIQENTDNEEEKTRKFSLKNLVAKIQANSPGTSTEVATRQAAVMQDYSGEEVDLKEFGEDPVELQRSAEAKAAEDAPEEKKGIVGWIKENPLLTAGIATVVVGGTILAIRASKKRKGLAGAPKVKKVKRRKTTTTSGATKPKPKRKTTRTVKRRRKSPVRKTTRVQKVELL